MAACVTPVIVDLSSDSEHEDDNSQPNSRKSEQRAFDWTAYEYPVSADDVLDVCYKPDNDEHDKASISSAETEIYTPDIDDVITSGESPVKRSSSQKESKADRASQKEVEKFLKEQSKLEKKRLREEKKAEKLKEKRLRAAAVQKQKNLKPEESIKLLSIHIDIKVVNSQFGAALVTALQQAGIHYEVADQIKPFTIFWSKKVKDIIVSDEGMTQEDVGVKEEKELFYIINSIELAKLVSSNELLTHIQTINSIFEDKSLTVVIIGLEKYFQAQKKKLSQERSVQNGRKKGWKSSDECNFLYASWDEIQMALIELQIIGNCNHCTVESGEELASLVVSTTKSLSQLDYKKEKYQREERDMDWFAKGDSKQCVKVDKNGTGLEKLWQQQICQFNAVGLEMASAIISAYNSPRNLIESYKKCGSKGEGELLLQNILIRKDAGILSSTRRIGPEVSKKLYHFYMSDDPELEL